VSLQNENNKGIEERLSKIEERLDMIDNFLNSNTTRSSSSITHYSSFATAKDLYEQSDLRDEVRGFVERDFYISSNIEIRSAK